MDYFKELSNLDVQLVAVSKTKPKEDIQKLYDRGQRIFGENRVQEIVEKQATLPSDIKWHFIGHLQSKKTKEIAPFVTMIHSIDSFKLLNIVDREAQKNERKIDVLLQIKIASEESKYGFTSEELLSELDPSTFLHVNFRGVMGMATFTNDEQQVRSEFQKLAKNFTEIKSKFFSDDCDFDQISMGMSGDYKIAIEEGSTMVRIGSLLFGAR